MFQWRITFHRISLMLSPYWQIACHAFGLCWSMSCFSMKPGDRKHWLQRRINCKLNFRIFLINFYKALKPPHFFLTFQKWLPHQRCCICSKAHKLTNFFQPEFSWRRWVFSCKAIYSPVKDPLQSAFKDYLTVNKTSVPPYCISLGKTWKQKNRGIIMLSDYSIFNMVITV